MGSNSEQTLSLLDERHAIVNSGRLHWVHWAVVVLSLFLTLGAWQFSKTQVEKNASNRFQRASSQVLELVSERMQKYEDGLWGGVSAIQAQGGDISRENWQLFAESLRIDSKYPGINGIGVIHHVLPEGLEEYLAEQRQALPGYQIYPEHEEHEYFPITYIEPMNINAKAVGLDMAHEAKRYASAKRAGETGVAQITAPIVLVQDEGASPGFLFSAPFYEGGQYETAAEREKHFTGMVYAPFVFHKLMRGVLDQNRRQVRFSVQDGADLLYDESSAEEPAPDADDPYSTHLDLELYGRTWSFDIWATQDFRDQEATNEPTIILIGGIFIDAMLLTLFILLSKSNRRAINFADRVSSRLEYKAKALQASNAELEKFAYVTSHDLKTPLRGINDLAEYLEEDLEPYLANSDANPDVAHNIGRLHQQVRRMDGLINGILDYSSIRRGTNRLTTVDLEEVVEGLRSELGLRKDQMVTAGLLPTMTTDATRLQQVLANLIGNAHKYHHNQAEAEITIKASDNGDFYTFMVADNGPGIDPRFHKRIFEVFQTLQSQDDIESTGIGLSIVKKSVEIYGGTVKVHSKPGEGTSFSFSWPKVIERKKAA